MADALLPHFCHARPLPCSVVEDKIERGTSTSAVARDALGTFLRARQGPDGLPVRGSHCVNINDLGMIMVSLRPGLTCTAVIPLSYRGRV